MRIRNARLLALTIVLLLAATACGGGGDEGADEVRATSVAEEAPEEEAPEEEAQEGATEVAISADNLKFDTDVLTVSAEEDVDIVFDNQEEGVRHNVAVYTNDPGAREEIFVGKTFEGPEQRTYTFTAPEAGTYYFRCDTHPLSMTGTLTAV